MPLASEAIDVVEYDERRTRLFVRFRSGEAYAYGDVSPDVYRAFLEAPSKGRFFQAKIRDHYPFERLGRR